MEPNRRLLIILAFLLAALIAGGIFLSIMLTDKPEPPPPAGRSDLDLHLLQQAEYLRLDQQPVRDGSLPVPPPVGSGKANPFL